MFAHAREVEHALIVPRAQQRAGVALRAGVVLPGEHEGILRVQALGQRRQRQGIGVDRAAEARHRVRLRPVKAHAVAVVVRRDLEIKRRDLRPAAAVAPQCEPEVLLIRPIAVQPPRVAVDARHVQVPLPVGVRLLERRRHVRGQRLHGPVERVEKYLLVLQKPRALVVKAQLPEKVDRCVGKACEHVCFAPCLCVESIPILRRNIRPRKARCAGENPAFFRVIVTLPNHGCIFGKSFVYYPLRGCFAAGKMKNCRGDKS